MRREGPSARSCGVTVEKAEMTRSLRPGVRRRVGVHVARSVGVHAARSMVLVIGPLALACAGPGLERRFHQSQESWRQAAPAPPAADAAEPFAGAAELERATLVEAVLRRNPSLQAARWAWKAALARYPQETSLDDPLLGYGVAPASFGSSRVDDAHKVDLSQRLPFPGKLSLRGEIALAEAAAREQDMAAVRLRLAMLASLLFDELYYLDRALAINAEHVTLLDEFLQIATARYEVGRAAQQDPLQAEVERAHLLHREVVLETSRRIAREQLNVLLHRPPRSPLPAVPATLEPIDAPGLDDELDRDALIEEALAARPELRSLAARIEGREAAVALARREFFPDFTLTGSYNGVWQESDLQPFVGVQMNVPLRIDRRRAALDEMHARLARAESEREGLADEVRFAVESAVDRLQEARHVRHLFESRLLPAARDQVEAARAGFETGRNSFLALIEAERNLRTTRLGREQALTDVSRRGAELERAIGRIPGQAGGTTR